MPWEKKDATKHQKAAKSDADKRLWSAVANKVLHESGDEGKAIRIANAQINKKKR